eukprot:6184637-Pleurochrysis_carterae.AAC.7
MPLRNEIAELKRTAVATAAAHAAALTQAGTAADRKVQSAREDGERRAALGDNERSERQKAEAAVRHAPGKSVAALKQRMREQQQRLVDEVAAMDGEMRQRLERVRAEAAAEALAAVHAKLLALARVQHWPVPGAGERCRRKGRSRRGSTGHLNSLRLLQKRLDEECAQRAADADETGKFRAKVRRLELVAVGAHDSRICVSRDAVSCAKPITFYSLRVGIGTTCAFSARTYEFARQLVEKCGMSFEAANANALVLAMRMRKVPDADMLITFRFVRQAFHWLGT